ncbi:acetamidase/formamidase family protein [Corynebacterium sp. SCR221107]|uniref:acetamidase/formamidase family protein n=1 Tax=Corynebacterium sp. SCR221107 TaxID=3017361 RepID=UPI0022EC3241|nr:acetamidase/formamidase family protein [Corynebacterium sp. SCR221107]WBT08709.1 acetamidase/formamidase family protein [Corynebacterium sp. SCR221107]
MSPEHPAKAIAKSGERLLVHTMDCFSDSIVDESQLFSSVGWECINPATGPIAIEGAEPGDTLKVEVLSIKVGSVGTMTSHPDFGALPGTVEERTRKIKVINEVIQFDDRYKFPCRPMIGVIGTAPQVDTVPTGEPREHGGNMDTKEIVAGSTLYLPVNVEGANLALGDVHAIMGDGEVAVCGLEIAAEVEIEVSLIKGQPLPLPFLVSGDSAYTIASDRNLHTAVQESVRMMRDWISSNSTLDPTDTLLLLSLRGDTQISQIVDPQMTARFRVPLDLIGAYNIELP